MKGSCISNIYWFIVDQCTFNNDEFENNCNNVNLHAAELKKDDDDPCKLSFFGHFTRGPCKKLYNPLLDKRITSHFFISLK